METEEKMPFVHTIRQCQNESCTFNMGGLSPDWKFCPECGKPVEDQADPPLILKDSIARLALYKLDPYVFKLFMFIYFESEAVGVEWKRIKQVELEEDCGISHPKVLRSIKELKGDNCEESLVVGEDAGKLLHWITSEKKLDGWSKRQGYGIHDDLHDYERVKELLKPYLEARRKRQQRSYW